ncbi:MAG: alpha/beta hydrolase [Propionibacteriaceae bacterium]|jgi:acetyl esterase|nr:alpha/beta hydrolase [Propionibacteriaceae bacterium]
MSIDPVIQRIQAEVKAAAAKPSSQPAQWRAEALRLDQLMAAEAYGQPAAVETEDVFIDPPGLPRLRLRLYHPPADRTPTDGGADANDPDGGPTADQPGGPSDRRGAYLGFFGGAFRQGGLDFPSVDWTWRERARRSGSLVVGVDYALAPEHPYPTAVEQGHAALEWLAGQADRWRVDPDRLVIGGLSSGGNLAAAVALMARDRGGPRLALQILEVPALDLTGRHLDLAAARGLGAPGFLIKFGLRVVAKTYLGPRAAQLARQPYASPLLADDLAGLPPSLILTAEHDILRGDGLAYADRLRRAGVDATALVYTGQTHESSVFTRVLPSARHWQGVVNQALAACSNTNHPRTSCATFSRESTL